MSVTQMGRPPGYVTSWSVLLAGPPVHRKSQSLMQVEVCPAGTAWNVTMRRSAGSRASMR